MHTNINTLCDLPILVPQLIDTIKCLIWDIWEIRTSPILRHFHDLREIEKEADQLYNPVPVAETMKSIDVEMELWIPIILPISILSLQNNVMVLHEFLQDIRVRVHVHSKLS